MCATVRPRRKHLIVQDLHREIAQDFALSSNGWVFNGVQDLACVAWVWGQLAVVWGRENRH